MRFELGDKVIYTPEYEGKLQFGNPLFNQQGIIDQVCQQMDGVLYSVHFSSQAKNESTWAREEDLQPVAGISPETLAACDKVADDIIMQCALRKAREAGLLENTREKLKRAERNPSEDFDRVMEHIKKCEYDIAVCGNMEKGMTTRDIERFLRRELL